MENLELTIKKIIIESLNLEDITPEDIDSDDALFNDGLGLDSIDALELGLALKNHFDIKIETNDENIRNHFKSVATLATHIGEYISNTEVS
ncbi:phosphopantetheine-binding protein [Thaumasiovibrio subtropicus]|uniref:phosphopantetheine-binding protein n=1 Tax=Thaumasiovibrio subtropicus TaxID=1891207 RepID=UPI000B34C9FA|nr:phosphopantetheine-binding protein [Thaumasiovibrio subtropicus]